MSAPLEKIVRPAQSNAVTLPRRLIDPRSGPRERVVLQLGRGGSGRTFSGNASVSISSYCEAYTNETRSQ